MSSYDFIGENYFVPNEKEISFPFKRDLVIVLAESFETSFFDKNISREFIPAGRMMKARSEGLFTDNMQQILGTGWTIASMTAWHFGLPLKLPSFVAGNNYFSKRGFFPGAKSIFDLLRENGYETVLVLGSDSNFSNKRSLFTEHGNFKIMDRQYWEQLGWKLEKYKGTDWRFNDKFVFERALEEYKRLKKQGRPFVLFVETVDTHAPRGWSPIKNIKYGEIRDAFSNLDHNIDEFLYNIKATDPNNTAIAVIGDHLFMGDKEYLSKDERRIFNMFWTSNIKAMKAHQEKPISALDIAPT